MPSLARMLAFVTDDSSAALPPRTRRRVVVGVVGALVVTAGVCAAALALVGSPEWWRGLVAAAVVSAVAAALSLLPLLWGLRRSLNTAVAGYFLAMGVRVAATVGGGLLAMLAGNYPRMPTLVLLGVFYVAVLAVEALVVAGAAWTAGGAMMNDKLDGRSRTTISNQPLPS
jgi:hypothetical protein